jgi:surfactin family lipopeptide synthetase A
LHEQLAYWKRQLTDLPTLMKLPLDRPRPDRQSFRGSHETCVLPASVVAGIKALSRKYDVTIFTTLLAAFQVLLHYYTGQEDIVIGAPIAGRTHPETETLIGLFVNTLVIRARLAGSQTFADVLRGARATTLDAYARQDVPFEKLVEELNPERRSSYMPLVQVMLAVQEDAARIPQPARLRVDLVDIEPEIAKFDLMFVVISAESEFRAVAQYATDLFDAHTIRRLLSHYRALLTSAVADPTQRLSALALGTESERERWENAWAALRLDEPTTIDELQLRNQTD